MYTKILLLILALAFQLHFIQARNVPGYIITTEMDTVYGEIKLPRFNIMTGGWIFWGINLEPFHYKVMFRGEGEKKPGLYEPQDIAGYGFHFKEEHYVFKTFEIEMHSLVEENRKRPRFLNQFYEDGFYAYRDIVQNFSYFHYGFLNDDFVDHYDYYLYNDSHGLTRVVGSKEHQSLKELLNFYGLEEEFLQTLPNDIEFKGLKEVLRKYKRWKENRTGLIFNT